MRAPATNSHNVGIEAADHRHGKLESRVLFCGFKNVMDGVFLEDGIIGELSLDVTFIKVLR